MCGSWRCRKGWTLHRIGQELSSRKVAPTASVGRYATTAAEEHGDAQVEVATLVAMSVEAVMALRDVKNRLSEVVDQVEREHGRVVITRHGKPAAVVISTDDLASLEETLEVVSRPKLIQQIRESLAEIAAGDAEVLTKDEILAAIRP